MSAHKLRPDERGFSVIWPRETVAEIDRVKGPYITRNKYLLKIVTEHLKENEVLMSQKIALQGPSVSSTDSGGCS